MLLGCCVLVLNRFARAGVCVRRLELELSIDNATIGVNVSSAATFLSGKILPGDGLRTLTINVLKSYLSGPPINSRVLSAAVNVIVDTVVLPYVNSHFQGIPSACCPWFFLVTLPQKCG